MLFCTVALHKGIKNVQLKTKFAHDFYEHISVKNSNFVNFAWPIQIPAVKTSKWHFKEKFKYSNFCTIECISKANPKINTLTHDVKVFFMYLWFCCLEGSHLRNRILWSFLPACHTLGHAVPQIDTPEFLFHLIFPVAGEKYKWLTSWNIFEKWPTYWCRLSWTHWHAL